ncbi:MAG: acyl-CoA/acyl-ACP dehydrogenase [Dehalococcoidia bacterium]|nr:acyl-CoA/acyl-ACP dehydrogenase [Dehalococcoidia bacterium]
MPYSDDFSDLTSGQQLLKQEAHRFASEVMRPIGASLDDLPPEQVIASGSPLWDFFGKAYSSGHHLRGFPVELGGAGLGPLESHLVQEEFGWGNSGLAIGLGTASMPFRAAAMMGHPGLMREIVMPFVEDTEGKYIGCWGATEPNHGSDLIMGDPNSHLECSAYRDGDEWVIQGQKSAWVSNGTIATHCLAILNMSSDMGMRGAGTAIVPLNLPGVTKGPPTNKLGQRPLNQGEIFFDNVRIPAHYVLSEPSPAINDGGAGLAGANASMSSTFSGVARAAFEEALAYTQSRIQGGVPISSHQVVQKKLFDMFMRVQAARALSRKANQRLLSGLPTLHYSIAAKVLATRTAFDVASDASELFGAMGMVKGVLVEALLRDARAAIIEDGSNDTLSVAGGQNLLG